MPRHQGFKRSSLWETLSKVFRKSRLYNIKLNLGLKRFMHTIEKGEELLSNGSVPKETKLTGRNGTRNNPKNMVIDDLF